MNKIQTEILKLCQGKQLATEDITILLRRSPKFKNLATDTVEARFYQLQNLRALSLERKVEPSQLGGIRQVEYWLTTPVGDMLLITKPSRKKPKTST